LKCGLYLDNWVKMIKDHFRSIIKNILENFHEIFVLKAKGSNYADI
jgi:hypothetical protein